MILEYAFAADEAHGVVCGAEKPLSPEPYRKKIILELSGTHSGETRVVGRISEHHDKHVIFAIPTGAIC